MDGAGDDENDAYQNLVHERRATPVEQPVPQDSWYQGLCSTFCFQCNQICEMCEGPYLACFDGKLEALVRCLCLPCNVVYRAVNEQQTYFKQSGIVYLYLFLTVTVVVNLIVPLKEIVFPVSKNIQQYYMLFCIIIALTMMFYLGLFTYDRVEYRVWNLRAGYPPEALMRVFYQGGLYFFGFLSFLYSLGIANDAVTDGDPLKSTVQVMKALYIVVQMLFLNKFYKARIPDDTFAIQIVMAHLLGTNLSLWFWTLCSDEVAKPSNSTSKPIPFGHVEKYFSPLFVEYLLIAASLLYQIWQDLRPMHAVALPHCGTCACQIADDDGADPMGNQGRGAGGIRAAISRSLGLGVVTGCSFGAGFLVLVIGSAASGENREAYHVAYAYGVIILYITQIFACYIILLSVQGLEWRSSNRWLDHDDALLYITLLGSLLWEGFHMYSLILIDIKPTLEKRDVGHPHARHVDIGADVLGMLQYVLQTTTLIALRLHRPRRGRSAQGICECVLFLLTTNFGLWIENSFFVEIVITTPGEKYNSIQEHLKPLGYILHPLNIFFRFHSAVCCLIAWSMFRNRQ